MDHETYLGRVSRRMGIPPVEDQEKIPIVSRMKAENPSKKSWVFSDEELEAIAGALEATAVNYRIAIHSKCLSQESVATCKKRLLLGRSIINRITEGDHDEV